MDKEIKYETFLWDRDTWKWKATTIENVPILCEHCKRPIVVKPGKTKIRQNKNTVYHYKYFDYVCSRPWWRIVHPDYRRYRRVEITTTETNWVQEQIEIFKKALKAGRDGNELKEIIIKKYSELEACEIIDTLELNKEKV